MAASAENRRYPCPCCGLWTLTEPTGGSCAICPVCFWEDDPVQQDDPQYAGGANHVSLATARLNYIRIGACEAEFLPSVRSPKVEEIPTWRSRLPEREGDWDLGVKCSVIATARGILAGTIGILDGSSAMACTAVGLDQEDLRKHLLVFNIVASEIDDIPTGEARNLWEPEALAAKDAEAAAYASKVAPEVLDACRAIEAALQQEFNSVQP